MPSDCNLIELYSKLDNKLDDKLDHQLDHRLDPSGAARLLAVNFEVVERSFTIDSLIVEKQRTGLRPVRQGSRRAVCATACSENADSGGLSVFLAPPGFKEMAIGILSHALNRGLHAFTQSRKPAIAPDFVSCGPRIAPPANSSAQQLTIDNQGMFFCLSLIIQFAVYKIFHCALQRIWVPVLLINHMHFLMGNRSKLVYSASGAAYGDQPAFSVRAGISLAALGKTQPDMMLFQSL